MTTVDELRARRALRRLDRLREAHPKAFDLDMLPVTPAALAAALGEPRTGRPPSDDPAVVVTVRLPRSLLAAVDAAVADRAPAITRSGAIKAGLAKWLRAERRRRR